MPDKYDILVYGSGKTGKTEFAGSWSELGDVLFIDTGNGMLSILASERIKHKDRIYRVHIVDAAEDPHVKEPVGWLTCRQVIQDLHDTGAYDNLRPKTVVLDEMTAASTFALTRVLFDNKHVGMQPTQPDWGKLRNEEIWFINMGRALKGINFILICHEQYLKDDNTGRVWCLPSVVGKFAYEIGGYFDEVYHTHVDQIGGAHKYMMDTKSTGIVMAGSRFDLPSPQPTTCLSVKGSIEKLKAKYKTGQSTTVPTNP